jgi:hypothetical protein
MESEHLPPGARKTGARLGVHGRLRCIGRALRRANFVGLSASQAIPAILAVLALQTAAAQRTIHGSVRDSTSGAPIAGAVVILLDSNGHAAAQRSTNGAGEFRMLAPGSRVRGRVVRIGFRPSVFEFGPPGADSAMRIVMAPISAVLDVVHVSGRELCPDSPRDGAAFQLWDQARAALLATVVTRESEPARATTLVFQRHESPHDSLIGQETVVRRSGFTTRPFLAARSASQLVEKGYVIDDVSGRTYLAPDADVLLDETFQATHCFRIQLGGGDHAGEIGLAFQPISSRSGLVDVQGVIWLFRREPSLRSVEFQYVGPNLEAADDRPRGEIDFRTISKRFSFVDYWELLVPKVVIRAASAASVSSVGTVPGHAETRVVEDLFRAGGFVIDAHWSDTVWVAEPTGIAGRVLEEGTGQPLARVAVSFMGLADSLATDSTGNFEEVPMPPGRYQIKVADTSLAAYAKDRSSVRVVSVPRDSVPRLRFELPKLRDLVTQICRGPTTSYNPAMIVGRALFATDTVPTSAQLHASWRIAADANAVAAHLELTQFDRTVDLDRAGRFVICNVGLEQRIDLHLTFAGGAADTSMFIGRTAIGSLQWRLGSPVRR